MEKGKIICDYMGKKLKVDNYGDFQTTKYLFKAECVKAQLPEYEISRLTEPTKADEPSPLQAFYAANHLELVGLSPTGEPVEDLGKLADYSFSKRKYVCMVHHKEEELWFYHDGVWTPGGESTVKQDLVDVLGRAKRGLLLDVIANVNARCYIREPIFDKQPHLLNLANGVFNLKTWKLEEHSHKHYLTYKLPVKYREDAIPHAFLKVLREILPDLDDRYMVLEELAYCLWREMPIHRAFMWIGEGRNGKCQVAGDKVLMSDGTWRNIELIQVGDEVVSPQIDGSSICARVIETHSYIAKKTYEIREATRQHRLLYTCSTNHEIPIVRGYSKRLWKGSNNRNIWRVISHYPASRVARLHNHKSAYCTFSTTAVEFVHPNSTIDPYALGVFLGDGSFASNHKNSYTLDITTASACIIDSIKSRYDEFINSQQKQGTVAVSYRISIKGQFAAELTRLGLAGKDSGTKFIPNECLLSGISFRRELLAGLIDTDGFIDKQGSVSICTKSPTLAAHIKELTFSLGGYSVVLPITKTIKRIGFTGHYFNVSIQFKDWSQIPLKTWKSARLRQRRNDPRHIAVEAVKTKGGRVYGIEIDGPSKWYITNNWVVTHNSTVISCMDALLGSDNVSHTSIHEIIGDRFAAADVADKMANMGTDISSKEISNTGLIKRLTGDDMIRVQKKHRDPTQIRSSCKMFFCANILPEVEDNTDAWMSRWEITEFKQQFLGDKADRGLVKILTLPDELSGLLNLLLRVLKGLMEKQDFKKSATIQETRALWGEKADIVQNFIIQELVQEPNAKESKKVVYDKYAEFCQKRKFTQKGMVAFGQTLKEKVHGLGEMVTHTGGRDSPSVKFWVGIQLKGSKPAQSLGQSPEPVSPLINEPQRPEPKNIEDGIEVWKCSVCGKTNKETVITKTPKGDFCSACYTGAKRQEPEG